EEGGEGWVGVREEEVGGDEVVRLALVDELLDAIAVPLDGANNLGVERGPLGEGTEVLQELLAQPVLVGGDLLGGLQGLISGLAAVEGLESLLLEEAGQQFAGGTA